MALVFDIKGDMALFRKPYTTTSMVSYPFPPPTAIAGLIAGIIGINHEASINAKNASYWKQLSGVQVAISLLNPIRWMNTAVNLMKYKTPNADMSEHIQVKHQLVKNPSYRIYIQGGEIYSELKEKLEREEFIYTPYLGSAYAIADINYQGEFASMKSLVDSPFNTIVPSYEGLEVDIIRSGAVFSEQIPVQMSPERRLKQTLQVYYIPPNKKEKSALYIRNEGKVTSSLVNGEKVAWFNAW